jgi:putative endopeptidase
MHSLRAHVLAGTMLGVSALALLGPMPAASAEFTPTPPGAVDVSVRPTDDFYRYANGPWLAATQRPEGVATYDVSTALRAENVRRTREIIQAAVQAHGGTAQKIGDYYASRLDAAAIEARGLTPVMSDLTAIMAIGDRRALAVYLGGTLRPDDGTNTNTDGVLGAYIHQAFDDPDHYVPHLMQSGLGLDSGDYLDAVKAGHVAIYRDHVAAVLKLAGLSDPQGRADRVVALETALAKANTNIDDVAKTNNTWRRADFNTKAPGLDWAAYFKAAGLGQQMTFVVWHTSYLTGLAAAAAGQPLDAWRDYLAFHRLDHVTPVLPKAFGDEKHAFSAKLSGGTATTPYPVAEAVAATQAAMGDGVGRLYVARYFSPADKAAVTDMVENLRLAWRAHLAKADWMGAETRAKAQAKLDNLRVEVGYPASWVDYSGLTVVRGDAFGNLRRAEDFAWRHEIAKLSKPVDRGEWAGNVYPQQVGGLLYFSPNTEVFTAGIFQPPAFDPHGDAATNYGSEGAALAHEIGHTFDELGAEWDAQGRMVHWWTKDDLARFRAETEPLAAQFAAYCPKPGLCVKGDQVLSENAADLAGLRVAYDAYILSLHGQLAPVIDGLTGDQRFFLAFARRARRLQSDEALAKQIATDTHAPYEYRADTVRNVEAWRRAFGVKPGDRLYLTPEQQIQIW